MSEEIEHPGMAQRRQLLSAIVDAFREDDDWSDHIVCGFALVVELAGSDGGRGVAARSSDANGDTDLTPWAATGLLRFAWSEGMFDAADPDDEDEGDEP